MSDEVEKEPSRASKWLDIAFKISSTLMLLASPFIINAYQSKMSATTMLSQREQAESALRASMFSNLIGPLIGTSGGKGVDLEREQLLIELLVLNFDEHFESKPLLMHIDKRIVSEIRDSRKKNDARRSLRSIAHRVISRQIASLLNEGIGTDKTVIKSLFVMKPSIYNENKKDYEKASGESNVRYAGFGKEIPLEFPDRNYLLTVKIDECDWINESCDVSYTVKETQGKGSEEINRSFQLTAFDFPLTDNTLLADGNRFAMVLDGVSNDVVSLKVLWFPKAYFTPRERPINYSEIRKKLDLR